MPRSGSEGCEDEAGEDGCGEAIEVLEPKMLRINEFRIITMRKTIAMMTMMSMLIAMAMAMAMMVMMPWRR